MVQFENLLYTYSFISFHYFEEAIHKLYLGKYLLHKLLFPDCTRTFSLLLDVALNCQRDSAHEKQQQQTNKNPKPRLEGK